MAPTAKQPRQFTLTPAKRESVPLLVSLYGPSGGGKTYSALRLAVGMEQVRRETHPDEASKIVLIDTEAGRALHYADQFEFAHLPFTPPHDSLSYMEACEAAVAAGATTIIVDSMSHEHEGAGGLLEQHEQLCEDSGKGDKYKMKAWAILKPRRRRMIQAMIQLRVNFIFCFRAKEKIKVIGGGVPKPLGWMPIGAEELIYEMTVTALLLPGSGGVPTWQSNDVGTRGMLKLPAQFANNGTFTGQALDEATGARLGRWSRGDDAVQPASKPPSNWDEWATRSGMAFEALVRDLCAAGIIGPGGTFDDLDAHRRNSIFTRPEQVADWLAKQAEQGGE